MPIKTKHVAQKMREMAGYPELEYTYNVLRELVIEGLARHEVEVYQLVKDEYRMTANELAAIKQYSNVTAGTILVRLVDYGLLRRKKEKQQPINAWNFVYYVDDGKTMLTSSKNQSTSSERLEQN